MTKQHPEAAGFIEIESPAYLKHHRPSDHAADALNQGEARKHGDVQ